MAGVASIKGFFGKFKAAIKGEPKHTSSSQVSYKQASGRAKRTVSIPSARGRRTTKGAFGGTGTGRNLRGKPGVKLLKRTVKSGFKAQKRVVLGMQSGRQISETIGRRQWKRLERLGLTASWKEKNAKRKSENLIRYGTKHAPKAGAK